MKTTKRMVEARILLSNESYTIQLDLSKKGNDTNTLKHSIQKGPFTA
jgi:hypothetical protein